MIRSITLVATAALLAVPLVPAAAIPAFARKYRTTCATCHAPVPRLNAFGEAFAGNNGFAMSLDEPPRDTIATGDTELRLNRELPLAVRIDAYLAAYTKRRPGENALDQQLPWTMKLLSGGNVADRVSYYAYFLLSERGEVGGLEDAYVQFSDIAGSGVALLAGQFQVSGPLFKRELRLEYEDYQAYRVRVGDTRADLTYDRGLMALWSPREGTDVAVQLVNGRGLDEASSQRQYDTDGYKNVVLRLSQDVGPIRVGAFGYAGREGADGATSGIRIFGPDATLPIGKSGELNLQYLRRWDDDPFLGRCSVAAPCPGGRTRAVGSVVNAAMAEVILSPGGPLGRWHVTGLFNHIESDAPVVSLRLGEQDGSPGFLTRHRTGSLGLHYQLHRNVRLLGEAGWNVDREQLRIVTGFTTAF
jgi:hypothetical protein